MTLNEFIDQYEWEADGRIDTYHVLSKGQKGDCDDFGSTVSYIVSGGKLKMLWNILVGNHKFYWCRTYRGVPHVILWVKSKGWIDNTYPEWSDTSHDHFDLKYLWVKPFVKLALGKVIRE